jgi:DNA repair protein RecO (recombination protein O)
MHFSKAIVLSTEDFGEADRYIQFLSAEWGVITALAKSARKSKRRFVGGLDLFCHDEIFLKGNPREKPFLLEVSVLNSFQGLRENLERLMTGARMVEWVKRIVPVATPVPDIYRLLGQSLALLESETLPSQILLLGFVFKWKLLTELGLKPSIESCVKCDLGLAEQAYFDIAAGGILCRECLAVSPQAESFLLSETELFFLKSVEASKMKNSMALELPEAKLRFLHRITGLFTTYHSNSRLPD